MEKGIPPQEAMVQSLKELGLSEEFIRNLFGERGKEALQELPTKEEKG